METARNEDESNVRFVAGVHLGIAKQGRIRRAQPQGPGLLIARGQAYFTWLADPVSQRYWDDAHLTNSAIDVHSDDPAFGYRFTTDVLKEKGPSCSENRAWRLYSTQRLWSNHAKKRGLNRRPGPPVHDDLVEGDFTATKANELWITDMVESSNSVLQKNVLKQRGWATRKGLRLSIVRWIEATYHRRRHQRELGKFAPIEYETIQNAAYSA